MSGVRGGQGSTMSPPIALVFVRSGSWDTFMSMVRIPIFVGGLPSGRQGWKHLNFHSLGSDFDQTLMGTGT